MKRDQITEKEALNIIKLQLGFEEKTKFANVILDNSDNQNQWIHKISKLI